MGIIDFIKKQFINVIELESFEDNVLFKEIQIQDSQIQYGAQLIVRESQVAIFVNEGKLADVFYPGTYTLTTNNLPLLTNLKHWDKLFDSPFKSDVYFVNMKQFLANAWGTSQPIMMKDDNFGILRLRAFGKYSFKIKDPGYFIKQIMGLSPICSLSAIEPQLKNLIITSITDTLSNSHVSAIDIPSSQLQLSEKTSNILGVKFSDLGLELLSFTIESVSLPEAVQEAIDKRASIAAIGSLDNLTKYNVAESLNNGGSSNSDVIGLATSLGLGSVVAQQVVSSVNNKTEETIEAKLQSAKNLLDKGLISQEDYNNIKSDLLGKI